MKELADEPEEVYMGASKRSKANKYADLIEENEVDNFKRYQMTNKEKKAIRYRQIEDMQDRLENLDDDFAAIDNIVKRSSKKNDDDGIGAAAEREAAGSKFAKSLKSFIEKPKKKVAFAELKTKGVVGDELYEGQKEKLRDKKAARKDVEKQIKQGKEAGVQRMGE